jgi:hypothetical protein
MPAGAGAAVQDEARRCSTVYHAPTMAKAEAIRQSVTLPGPVARRVRALAKRKRTSANRVIVELIESGLEAEDQEKRQFFELAERLATSRDPDEQRRIKEELARITFGD